MKKYICILGVIAIAAVSIYAFALAGGPAARVGDYHVCPRVNPNGVPHVGGPILIGDPTVLICELPAARQSDLAQCNGPTDAIALGSTTVLIGGFPAARLGDPSVHGGQVTQGCGTVLIGP